MKWGEINEMWNKKIVITQHALKRFEQRNIKFSKYESNPVHQMLFDLRPLNVMKREKLENNHYKITTQQGKVYIVAEYDNVCFVKTVYKTSLMYENYLRAMKEERLLNDKYRKNNK